MNLSRNTDLIDIPQSEALYTVYATNFLPGSQRSGSHFEKGFPLIIVSGFNDKGIVADGN